MPGRLYASILFNHSSVTPYTDPLYVRFIDQAVQDCYQESDLEAIAQCSCGDQVLGALRECSSCAADTDSLTEAEKQSLQSNLDGKLSL